MIIDIVSDANLRILKARFGSVVVPVLSLISLNVGGVGLGKQQSPTWCIVDRTLFIISTLAGWLSRTRSE